MHPAFVNNSLTDPVPLWGTWVRTGAGSFGWLSAWLPAWAYIVAACATGLAVLAGLAAILREPDSPISRTARQAIYAILAFLLVLHVTEIVSLINGTGLVLQGRYLLPAIPLLALAFTAPLAQLPERARTTVLAASLASWGLISLVGFATLISFFST
jgi:hypothetical protein